MNLKQWMLLIIFFVCVYLIFFHNHVESFRGGRRRHRRHGGWRGWGGHGSWGRRGGWRPFWRNWGGYCPNGCTSLGNNAWGCQYPGNGSNDCMFGYDCKYCGGSRWW
jgi:hypothetical protein